jgi:probable HAF family extracellular repeat protein
MVVGQSSEPSAPEEDLPFWSSYHRTSSIDARSPTGFIPLSSMAPPRASSPRCFVWTNEKGYDDIAIKINATNPPLCVAHAVNNNGLVVGTYWRADNTTSAFSYYAATGRVTDLGRVTGVKNTEARGVSDVGEVVGWGLEVGAIYWSGFARWEAIADSEIAESINSRAQVAGLAKSTQFRSQPVVWTPGSAHGIWTPMPLGYLTNLLTHYVGA